MTAAAIKAKKRCATCGELLPVGEVMGLAHFQTCKARA